MNTTKQKILSKSLELFNSNGVSNISLRTIADEIGISIGNLQYHFKKREDIIKALYFQLVDTIDNAIIIKNDSLLRSFFNISTTIITILYEYHFFLLDFALIVRNNKKIKVHYSKLSKQREMEFLQIVEVLIENDLFRKELLKNEYKHLFKRIEVISNFWFSSILIQADELSKECIKDYSLLVSQSIYMYLTEQGKKQYFIMFPNQLV